MKGMKAKVKVTGEIVEVREWCGASDVVYSTLDMNRFFAANAIEFVAPESESLFGWVARDKDGELYYYHSKPKRVTDSTFGDGNIPLTLPRNMFPTIKWDNEPLPVEIIINPM